MLYPSIDDLLEKVNSKYLLVTLASKRARKMQYSNEKYMDHYISEKNVGKALEEINAYQILIDDGSISKATMDKDQNKDVEIE